jgi:hypothetical protein
VTTALMSSTQITYQFTMTVNVNMNADKALFLLLACFAFVLWTVRRFLYEISRLLSEIKEAVQFTSKVFIIAVKSLLYGFIGVRL